MAITKKIWKKNQNDTLISLVSSYNLLGTYPNIFTADLFLVIYDIDFNELCW